jgi:hypothetical protein
MQFVMAHEVDACDLLDDGILCSMILPEHLIPCQESLCSPLIVQVGICQMFKVSIAKELVLSCRWRCVVVSHVFITIY